MSDNVDVNFRAETEGVLGGINAVTDRLENFSSTVEGMSSVLTGFAEAAAAAFAIEKIADWNREVTESAVQLSKMEQQLGVTQQGINILSFAAENNDQQLQQVVRSMTTFSRVAEEATKGTNQQAAAFQALGINAKAYLDSGHSVEQLMELSIQKLGGYADGMNKAALVSVIFGGRSASLIAILNELARKHDELKAAVDRAGTTVADFDKKGVEMQKQLTELDGAWTGFTRRIYSDVEPALKSVIGLFTTLIEKINTAMDDLKGWGDAGGVMSGGILGMAAHAFIGNRVRNATDDYYAKNPKKGEGMLGAAGGDAENNGLPQAPLLPDLEGLKKAQADALALQKAYLQNALDADKGNYEAMLVDAQKYFNFVSSHYGSQSKEAIEAATKIEQIQNQEIETLTRKWDQFFNSFNQGLFSMLRGTGSWKDAVSNMFWSFVQTQVKNMEKMAAQWIATEHVKTAATIQGTAVRTAAESAGAHAAGASKFAAAIKDITADMAKTYAGVYGFFSPVLGPFAAIPAAASAAVVGGMKALIPSYAVGTPYVPQTGLAMLHEGERVVTAAENSGGGFGGGGTVNFHVYAMDSQDVKRFFRANAGAIVESLQQAKKNNHRGATA